MSPAHVPPNLRTVNPYFVVVNATRFIDFLTAAFKAELVDRYEEHGIVRQAQMRIGDSVVELGQSTGEWKPLHLGIHLYVPDSDATHAAALKAGAKSLQEVQNMPYGERSGAVEDPFGNSWFIATFTG